MKNLITDITEAEVNEDFKELELIEKKVKKLLGYTLDNKIIRFACLSEFKRLSAEEKEYKEILHLIAQKKERVYNIIK